MALLGAMVSQDIAKNWRGQLTNQIALATKMTDDESSSELTSAHSTPVPESQFWISVLVYRRGTRGSG